MKFSHRGTVARRCWVVFLQEGLEPPSQVLWRSTGQEGAGCKMAQEAHFFHTTVEFA